MINFIVQFLVALALNVVAYLLQPKPKQQKPDAAKSMDDPTAEAGREIPVLFGTKLRKDPNCLWFGDKGMNTYKVKV